MTAQLALFREALSPATVLKHARQLARVVPRRPKVTRTDGVVPITRDDALAWSRRESLERLGDEGIVFKLAVAGPEGIGAVCFGALPVGGGARRAIELTPIAPRANEAAFQAALRAGAAAAVAMGFEDVHYYRPIGDDLDHPFTGFEPLAPRAFRGQRGGGLAWRRDALDYYEPWLRAAAPDRFLALKAEELVHRQYLAVLEWEEAEQELLSATDHDPTDAQYVALARRLGFDYYDDWRPAEMTTLDAMQFLSEDGLFERWTLAAAPRKPGALFVEAVPFTYARDVSAAWHSHLQRKEALRTHLFSLAVFAREVPGVYPEHLRAVAIVTSPVSQALTVQGGVVEVARVAVGTGLPPLAGVDARHRGSEASFVLAAVERAALALGYDRVVSSTLLGEAGAGYRAAGWHPVAVGLGGQWDREGRPREEAEQDGIKIRWETGPGAAVPVKHPEAGTVDALVRVAAELHKVDRLPLGGVARGAKPNDAEAWVRDLFAREQARFAAAYGPRSLPATAVLDLVDARCPGDKGPCGLRNVAQATWLAGQGAHGGGRSRGRVEIARRALALPVGSLVAVIRHELGHLADDRVDAPGAEKRADHIGESVGGQPFYYDANHLQTVDPSAPGAHRGRPSHLHQ